MAGVRVGRRRRLLYLLVAVMISMETCLETSRAQDEGLSENPRTHFGRPVSQQTDFFSDDANEAARCGVFTWAIQQGQDCDERAQDNDTFTKFLTLEILAKHGLANQSFITPAAIKESYGTYCTLYPNVTECVGGKCVCAINATTGTCLVGEGPPSANYIADCRAKFDQLPLLDPGSSSTMTPSPFVMFVLVVAIVRVVHLAAVGGRHCGASLAKEAPSYSQ